jgi:transcriptional regulator with XRE-family HTH domain
MENILKKNSFLSGNIKYIRTKNKLNQTQFAKLLDKKTSVISAYEKGETTPPLEIIFLLSNTFGISVSDLIETDLSNSEQAINKIPEKIVELNNKFGWENKPKWNLLSNNDVVNAMIETNLFRINEVKHLIETFADKNGFRKDKVFSTYESTIKNNKLEELVETYSSNSKENLSDDFIETLSFVVNQSLFSIYNDLFNIVNFETFIYDRK